VPRATLRESQIHNSWELTFERKPPKWVLDAFKARKWRWSGRKACWYKTRTRSTDSMVRTNDDSIAVGFVYQFLSAEQKRQFCGEEHAG
jgi:hypothetical protein